jgi:hypothetical protein
MPQRRHTLASREYDDELYDRDDGEEQEQLRHID